MKRFLTFISAVLLASVFILSTSSQLIAADKILRIASIVPVGTHHDDFCRYFAKNVNKADVGLKVKVISGTALGNAPQTVDQLVEGSLAMVGNDAAWVASFDDDLKILNWGYAFRDKDHQGKFFNSPLFAGILDRIRKKHGIRVLAVTSAQERLIFSTKPFRNIEEVKGLKIRVPQIKVWVETWKVYGANPTPLNFHEVYLALKTGVIEAGGGQASPSYQYKYHTAAKYIMGMGHILPASFIAINEKRFQSLSPKQQQVVTEMGKRAMQWAYFDAESNEEKTLKKMVAEGAVIVPVDNSGFKKASKEASYRMEAEGVWSKGFYDKIQAIK